MLPGSDLARDVTDRSHHGLIQIGHMRAQMSWRSCLSFYWDDWREPDHADYGRRAWADLRRRDGTFRARAVWAGTRDFAVSSP